MDDIQIIIRKLYDIRCFRYGMPITYYEVMDETTPRDCIIVGKKYVCDLHIILHGYREYRLYIGLDGLILSHGDIVLKDEIKACKYMLDKIQGVPDLLIYVPLLLRFLHDHDNQGEEVLRL